MHHILHFLQLTYPNRLEWGLDQSPCEEVQCLSRVFPVANIPSLDCFHADDSFEDRSFEVGARRQTNGDDGTTRADVLVTWLARLMLVVMYGDNLAIEVSNA